MRRPGRRSLPQSRSDAVAPINRLRLVVESKSTTEAADPILHAFTTAFVSKKSLPSSASARCRDRGSISFLRIRRA